MYNQIENEDGQLSIFAEGGSTSEGIDLFEDYDNIPSKVQKVLDKYEDAFMDGSYSGLAQALKAVEKIGYTFEYYLDGAAYDLRPIGTKGKSEDDEDYAKGGEISYKDALDKFNEKILNNEGVLKASKHYNKTPQEVVKNLQTKISVLRYNDKSIKEVKIDFTDSDSNIKVKEKLSFEDGGMMAKGGMIKYVFDIYPFGEDEDIDRKSKKVLTIYTSNRSKAYEKAKKQYPNHFVELADSYVEDKMAAGGMMAEGGEIENENYEMLESLIVQIKHHAKELDYIDNVEIEAWVLSKAQRAATDLSDITHYLDGKKAEGMMAKGGMVVTSIKDIPNFKQRLDEGKITYRGLGLGKLWDDFNKLTGTTGTRIKVDGKEYFITDEEFNTFSRGADGKLRIRFEAPFRKSYEDGGYMAKGGKVKVFNTNFENKFNINDKDFEDAIFAYYDTGSLDNLERITSRINLVSLQKKFGDDKNKEVMEYIKEKFKTIGIFKDGGFMAKGGGVEDKFKGKNSKEVWNNLDSSTRAKVLEYLFLKEKSGDNQYYDSYNSLNELSYNEWDKLPKNIKKEIENFDNGGYMAKGGETSDAEYRKRMKQFGFKPYGKTQGKYKIEFVEDGIKQSEIWESKEMAEDREKKLLKIGGTNIKVTKLPTMNMGGKVTFDDKVSSIKKSLLKTKKVSPKVQKDYGKTYNEKEAVESAKRIAGAMKAKYKK
jgi:hypothetical protein